MASQKPLDESQLYDAILAVFLEHPGEWLSSVELQGHEKILKLNPSKNVVSNYLGNLARKNVLKRDGAKGHHRFDGSRYVYAYEPAGGDITSSLLVSKPNMKISDDGNTVTVDLPNWSITIKHK